MANRARIAVLISGRGSNMTALIFAAKAEDCPFEIALVASDKGDAQGLEIARAEGIATFTLSDDESELDRLLNKACVDYVALAGFMRILGPDFVAKWEGRMINIHPSLLPKYKGLRTHARALADGETFSGASVHAVTAKVDDGEVLGQTAVAILPNDTAETLAERVLIAEHELYPRVLAAYVSREIDPDWIVAKVGSLALALHETDARTSHGSPGWRVGGEKSGKFFAYVSVRHHGEDAVALLVKTSGTDEMNALIDADPDIYYRPAYYGASGWIALRLDRSDVDWDHVAEWLAKSWRAVAPKRLTKFMDVTAEF